MPTLTMRELAEMTHGEVVQNPDVIISSVVIDSREVKPDSAFFAIKGERLDGHQFVPQALETARGAVVARIPESVARDKGIVRVADTTKALQELLCVQRRENIIKRTRVVLRMQALKVLRDPRPSVPFLKFTSALQREFAQRIRELS